VLRVRTSFAGVAGAPYLSTMYFMTGDTLPDAQAANTAVGTFWSTIDAQLLTSLSWSTDPEVSVLTTAGVLTGSHAVTPVTGTGNIAGSLTPPATQGLVRWATPIYVAGRRVRGRTFIPAIPQSLLSSSGGPALALSTAVNNAAAALIADANANLGIWSRKNGGIHAVTTGGMWSQFAVLRSRRD